MHGFVRSDGGGGEVCWQVFCWGLLVLCGVVFPGTPLSAQSSVPFRTPGGLAFDSAGNLYVADATLHQVLEVSLAGTVAIVAGTGTQGFGGDGGAATLALLNAPAAVSVAADGTVYVADAGNERIRAVSPAGIISTLAGTGAKGFSGDGGLATLAAFSGPAALALDAAGGLLVADRGNHRVRRVFAGTVATFAGTGVQGFSGDGGTATAAALDSPAGLAVGTDGRVWITDARNERVRVVGTDGVIATFAGNGANGFSGDAGPATAAQLDGPAGLAVSSAGALLIADAGNHRLRLVSPSGTIVTISGTSVQGDAATPATALNSALDTPRGVAMASDGTVFFSDARNGTVEEIASDGSLYAIGLPPLASAVSLAGTGAGVYGSASLTATVLSAAPAVRGTLTLTEAGLSIASSPLSGGSATLSLAALTAGNHTLTGTYSGDFLHGAATTSGTNLTIAPRPVSAIANAVSIPYGAYIPSLTGTLTGVLSRDAAVVTALYRTTAADLAPVGVYPISASLAGAAAPNYSLTLVPGSGSLTVVPAAVAVTLATQGTYAGLPVLLTATVGSTTRGVPTGDVHFLDGSTEVAVATLAGGVASAAYLAPPAGSRALTAVYPGDATFQTGTSPQVTAVLNALPDFTLAPQGSASQTVQGGAIASYTLLATPQSGAFSGAISFSVAGLQPGAQASFSPPSVVPGAAAAPVALTVQTVAATSRWRGWTGGVTFALCALGLVTLRRKRLASAFAASVALGLLAGCGARTTESTVTPHVYDVVVTGTATNLAGTIVTHTCTVSLTVR